MHFIFVSKLFPSLFDYSTLFALERVNSTKPAHSKKVFMFSFIENILYRLPREDD